jgi:hypothetical protein
LSKLLWPERIIKHDLDKISEQGVRKYILKSSWKTLIIGTCMIIAYFFIEIELKTLWIIMGAIIIFIPIFFFLKKSADTDVKSMFANISEITISKMIQKKRVQALGSLVILIAWIYSWRVVFT